MGFLKPATEPEQISTATPNWGKLRKEKGTGKENETGVILKEKARGLFVN